MKSVVSGKPWSRSMLLSLKLRLWTKITINISPAMVLYKIICICNCLTLGWIPRDFLYSRMMVLELFCWHCLIQFFFCSFVWAEKIFEKTINFRWKVTFCEKGMNLKGSSWGFLAETMLIRKKIFHYQNRHMRSPQKSPLYTKNLENTRSFRHFRFILQFSF